jgi:hypothetical protein
MGCEYMIVIIIRNSAKRRLCVLVLGCNVSFDAVDYRETVLFGVCERRKVIEIVRVARVSGYGYCPLRGCVSSHTLFPLLPTSSIASLCM